jgi:hypothetical protein
LPANPPNNNGGEQASPEFFRAGIEFARANGQARQIQNASTTASYLTARHLVFCDESGRELIRYHRYAINAKSPTDDRSRAVAWARSMGYPVPSEPNGCLNTILIVAGLLIYIVPGVIILVWVAYSGQVYERELNSLVTRWVAAGKPEPGVATNLDNKITAATERPLQERLAEFKEMLEKSLISSEEYEALRKKALGL